MERKRIFKRSNWYRATDLLLALRTQPEVRRACSLQLAEEEELARLEDEIRGLLEEHSEWARATMEAFPHGKCGPSSNNVILTAMARGNPAGLYVASQGHAFCLWPWLLDGRQGVLLGDPTSDQPYRRAPVAPPNLVRVIEGTNVVHRTAWKDGAELRPEKAIARGDYWEFARTAFLLGDIVRPYARPAELKKLLAAAYANPVRREG